MTYYRSDNQNRAMNSTSNHKKKPNRRLRSIRHRDIQRGHDHPQTDLQPPRSPMDCKAFE